MAWVDHPDKDRLTHITEIIEYLGFDRNKFYRNMYHDLVDSGVIMFERYGVPPRKRAFTYKPILHRWMVIQAQAGRIF